MREYSLYLRQTRKPTTTWEWFAKRSIFELADHLLGYNNKNDVKLYHLEEVGNKNKGALIQGFDLSDLAKQCQNNKVMIKQGIDVITTISNPIVIYPGSFVYGKTSPEVTYHPVSAKEIRKFFKMYQQSRQLSTMPK